MNVTYEETYICQNFQVEKIKQFLCDFYLKGISPPIDNFERNIIEKKYDELVLGNRSVIKAYLDKIASIVQKYILR